MNAMHASERNRGCLANRPMQRQMFVAIIVALLKFIIPSHHRTSRLDIETIDRGRSTFHYFTHKNRAWLPFADRHTLKKLSHITNRLTFLGTFKSIAFLQNRSIFIHRAELPSARRLSW
jgi:hypothetical protein